MSAYRQQDPVVLQRRIEELERLTITLRSMVSCEGRGVLARRKYRTAALLGATAGIWFVHGIIRVSQGSYGVAALALAIVLVNLYLLISGRPRALPKTGGPFVEIVGEGPVDITDCVFSKEPG